MRMITKFNRMIKNRTLWAIFAAIISVSFVGAFSQTGGCEATEGRDRMSTGRLFGENVSREDFSRARFFALGMNDSGGWSEEEQAELRKAVWQRLAMLHKAQALGIEVSEDELDRTIRETPMFSRPNEGFDSDYYKGVVRQQYRVPVGLFEEYLRQAIVLQKATHLLDLSVWTPPGDIADELSNLSDMFEVDYVLLKPNDILDDTPVTAAQAKTFYEDNPDLFSEPEKVSVRYVVFPVSNYLDRAAVKDESVEAYYQANVTSLYTSEGTNGTPIVQPLEAVRDAIESELREEAAFALARTEATDLVMALAPSRYSKGQPWNDAVRLRELNVATSELFSARSEVPDLPVDPDDLQTAFDLDASNPNRYFSGAMLGSDGVYVMAAHERQAAYVPEFGDVVEQVMPLAKDHVRQNAFSEKANELSKAIKEKMAAGESFATAVQALGLDIEAHTTRPFSIYEEHMRQYMETEDGPAPLPYPWVFLSRIGSLGSGDVMDPVEVDEGMLLAHVAQRRPGDIGAMDYMRPSVLAQENRRKTERLYEGWMDHLLALAKFEDTEQADDKDAASESSL